MRNILWKRCDREGHDACRFMPDGVLPIIEGCATFMQGTEAAQLFYRVVCDESWGSICARVSGWVGARNIDILIQLEDSGSWSINGIAAEGLAGLQDIDLGFTPATNTNALRRLDSRIGEEIETTAVWLDTDDWAVKRLTQVYRRIDRYAYDYRSPLHDFQATLIVDEFGVITDYPGLWVAVR